MALQNDWEKIFSHRATQNLVSYLLTQNCSSQVVVAAGAETEIDDTGTAIAIINGTPVVLPVDTDCELNADRAYAAWATSTGYTTDGLVSEVTVDGRHFVCILAHTSSAVATAAGDKPLIGINWKTYWRELDAFAIDAYQEDIPDGSVTPQTRYYLVCAIAAGNIRVFKAYSGTGASTLVIPAYDPTRWVALAIVKVVWVGASVFDVGVDNWNAAGATTTVWQLTGPVFPGQSVIDKN